MLLLLWWFVESVDAGFVVGVVDVVAVAVVVVVVVVVLSILIKIKNKYLATYP
jgi:hypothetical protein